MKFKDFEIQPTSYLDGHTEPNKFGVVKYHDHDPVEVIDFKTGEKKIITRSCFVVAYIWWNEKEPCWEFESVGTRFLEHYENGLTDFILKWLEMYDLCRAYDKT